MNSRLVGPIVSAKVAAVACGGGEGEQSPLAPTLVDGGTPVSPSAPTPVPTTTNAANSLYASPTGSDAAIGRTSQSALRTLARALQVVQPGETVRMRPGMYVESRDN